MKRSFLLWSTLLLFSSLQGEAPSQELSRHDRQVVLQKYQIAKKAAESGEHRTAIIYYGEILEGAAKEQLQQGAVAEISLGMAESHLQLREYRKAEELVAPFLSAELPSHLHLKAHLIQSRLLFQKRELVASHAILLKLKEQFSTVEWSPNDRALLLMVENQLNQHYEEKLQKAERLYSGASIRRSRKALFPRFPKNPRQSLPC